jgi:hypothetical protein
MVRGRAGVAAAPDSPAPVDHILPGAWASRSVRVRKNTSSARSITPSAWGSSPRRSAQRRSSGQPAVSWRAWCSRRTAWRWATWSRAQNRVCSCGRLPSTARHWAVRASRRAASSRRRWSACSASRDASHITSVKDDPSMAVAEAALASPRRSPTE